MAETESPLVILLKTLAYVWLIMAGVCACAAVMSRPPRLGYWLPAFALLLASTWLFLILGWIG